MKQGKKRLRAWLKRTISDCRYRLKPAYEKMLDRMPHSNVLREYPWGKESAVSVVGISQATLQQKRIHYAEEWEIGIHFRFSADGQRLYNLPLLMAETLWGVKSDSYKIVLAHWTDAKQAQQHLGLW